MTLQQRAAILAAAFVCGSAGITTLAQAQVDELLVTATRREQSVQDIPIAVSAFSDVQIKNAGVDDINDLMSIAPSFQTSTNATETQGTVIRLRGVGTQGNNPGFESAVGVFIDGVYRARAGIALSEFLDIERVEVLRGPQGTLFGRNTSAGALNIITKGPEFEFGGYAEGTYGNYDTWDARGSVTGPIIGDVLAGRFSAVWDQRNDGFVEDLLTDEDLNTRDRYMLKGQLLVAAGEKADFRLIGDYRSTDDSCCYPVTLGIARASGATIPGVAAAIINDTVSHSALVTPAATVPFLPLGTQLTGGAFDRKGTLTPGVAVEQAVEDWGVSGEFNWDVGFGKLTSISSYRDFKSDSANDIDFTTADLLRNSRTDTNKIFTQELRLQGEAGKLNWLVGGFYVNEKITLQNTTVYGADYEHFMDARLGSLYGTLLLSPAIRTRDFIFALTGGAINTDTFNGGAGGWAAGTGALLDDIEQDGESYSFFTHNTFSFTDSLRLTLGARFTVDEKDASSEYTTSDAGCGAMRTALANHPLIGNSGPLFNAQMRDLTGVNGAIFPNDERRVRDVVATLACLQIASRSFDLQHLSGSDTINKDDDEWSGTAVLDYDLSPDALVYASYSRGFKAGGINLDRAGTVLTEPGNVVASGARRFDLYNFLDPRFNSEIVDAYEIGLKTAWLSNRLTMNLAVFYEDFDNFQLNTFTGFSFQPENVEKATSKGVELEMATQPVEGLNLSLGVAYTEASYDDKITDVSNVLVNDNFNATGNPLGVTSRGSTCSNYALALPPGNCNNGGDLTEVSTLAGKTLTNASKWVVTGGITYTRPIANAVEAFIHIDGRYDSGYNTGSDLDEIKEQGGYTVFDGRLGMSAYDGALQVELWARNLTDKQYKSIAFDIPLQAENGFGVFLADPRTYGITLRSVF